MSHQILRMIMSAQNQTWATWEWLKWQVFFRTLTLMAHEYAAPWLTRTCSTYLESSINPSFNTFCSSVWQYFIDFLLSKYPHFDKDYALILLIPLMVNPKSYMMSSWSSWMQSMPHSSVSSIICWAAQRIERFI